MQTKHTKGEWLINGNQIQVSPEDPMNTQSICMMFGNISNVENHSNAKLIAAAPDLLEACITLEDIVSEIEARLDDGQPIDKHLSWDELRSAWLQAQTAIKKAIE